MSVLIKYLKNIEKQYGKNIKAFETNIQKDPSKEIQNLHKKIKKETTKTIYINGKAKSVSLDLGLRKPMISILNNRWGFSSSEQNLVSCYNDIQDIIKNG